MEMIDKLRVDFDFQDDRGSLTQLVHNGYSQINILFSKKGVSRGGHYHKKSIECFYVVSGSVTVKAKLGIEEAMFQFFKWDFFRININVIHSMYFPEDCILVAMYDKCVELENGDKDIYPVE